MIAFPPASELDHLIGDMLEQVRLDPFSVQFLFERSRMIAKFAVEQVEPDGRVWAYECVAADAPPSMLHRLVGRTVVSISTEGFRMSLTFDNRAVLHMLSDQGSLEAGHIDGCGKFIVF